MKFEALGRLASDPLRYAVVSVGEFGPHVR